MRVILTLATDHALILPTHYNYGIQSLIYAAINDPALQSLIHDTGFIYEKRSFKMFTFSRLIGPVVHVGNRFQFTSPVTLHLSSPFDNLIQEIAKFIFERGMVTLHGNELMVTDFHVEQPPAFGTDHTVRMLSPMVMYTTLENERRKFRYYLNPWQDEFAELIHNNLRKKFVSFYDREPVSSDFALKPLTEMRPELQKVILYKGGVIKGWIGRYHVHGDPEMLRFAYDAGFGGKNSQGFGCFAVDDNPRPIDQVVGLTNAPETGDDRESL